MGRENAHVIGINQSTHSKWGYGREAKACGICPQQRILGRRLETNGFYVGGTAKVRMDCTRLERRVVCDWRG